MDLEIYVGPFIVIDRFQELREIIEAHEHLVQEARGELGVREDVTYVIPNVKVPGITRQMTFGTDSELSVVDFDRFEVDRVIVSERWKFHDFAIEFIRAVRSKGVRISVSWGIIPRYY